MTRENEYGGRRKMTTAIKPIRPTVIEFEEKDEMEKFLNYATSMTKDKSAGMERVRQMMKDHKLAPKRK
jgi:hypothetical protein